MRLFYLKALLQQALVTGNRRLVKLFLRSLFNGKTPKSSVVNAIIEDIRRDTAKVNRGIAKVKYLNIATQKNPSLLPLQEYLKERERIMEFMLKNYGKTIINESTNLINLSAQIEEIEEKAARLDGLSVVSVGRRRGDLFRKIGLKNLEKSFLYGSPTARGDKLILAELKKNSQIFNSKGKMILPVRSKGKTGKLDYYGKTRAYGPKQYAEMVSLATVQEMDIAGNIENAKNMKTRLLKWSTTGKSKMQYIKENDLRCAAVDNEYCTYVKGGIVLAGRRVPHIKELLPGPFNIPHPYCRHTLKPVPESLYGGER